MKAMKGVMLSGLMLMATDALAQSSNQVTLKFDDGEGVTGELLEYAGEIFRIQASVGLVAIPASDVSCIGAACPEGTRPEIPPAPVTLTSHDGNLVVSGDVIEFVDGEYVVATRIGELRIDASQVTCEGIGCVDTTEKVSREVSLVNGAVKVDGELLGLEDGVYVVEVDGIGQMRIPADTFECVGPGCP